MCDGKQLFKGHFETAVLVITDPSELALELGLEFHFCGIVEFGDRRIEVPLFVVPLQTVEAANDTNMRAKLDDVQVTD